MRTTLLTLSFMSFTLAGGGSWHLQVAATQSSTSLPPATSTRVGVALVITNSAYPLAPLPSVDEDRRTMADALESMGFAVREAQNLRTARDFENTLRDFLTETNAGNEDLLLVYYSGHGLQIDGKATLLGVGVPPNSDSIASLRPYAQEVDGLISEMEKATPAARVLIVDACRNNVFASTAKKAVTSFSRYITDTFILFADAPGKTVPARSASSIQSPFTKALIFAFQTSDGGLQERFKIAQQKTRELNPDQNPEMLMSDASENRNLPFLDHGGRSAPVESAGDLLNEAESFYTRRSWPAFHDKIREARVLSVDPALTARLEKELAFHDLVTAALKAEGGQSPRWADAAQSWQKAIAVFPARVWVGERAAAAWLLADRLPEAAAELGRLTAYEAMSKRASEMLAALVSFDPALEAIAGAARKDARATLGPEFERYAKGQ